MESRNSSRTISLSRLTSSAESLLRRILLSTPQKHSISLTPSISSNVETIEDLGPKEIEETTEIEKIEETEEIGEKEERDQIENIGEKGGRDQIEKTEEIGEKEEIEETDRKEEREEIERTDLNALKEKDKSGIIGTTDTTTIDRTIREENADVMLPGGNTIATSTERTELKDRESIDLAESTPRREKKTEEIENLSAGPDSPTSCLPTMGSTSTSRYLYFN